MRPTLKGPNPNDTPLTPSLLLYHKKQQGLEMVVEHFYSKLLHQPYIQY